MTPMEQAVDAAAREARARHLLGRDYHGVRQDVRDRALQDLRDEWDTLPDHVHEHWRAKVLPVLHAGLGILAEGTTHECMEYHPDPDTCRGCLFQHMADELGPIGA